MRLQRRVQAAVQHHGSNEQPTETGVQRRGKTCTVTRKCCGHVCLYVVIMPLVLIPEDTV